MVVSRREGAWLAGFVRVLGRAYRVSCLDLAAEEDDRAQVVMHGGPGQVQGRYVSTKRRRAVHVRERWYRVAS
jgi:hypothetical protein